MQVSVLLSLRVTQAPWTPESSHMTCCSFVLCVVVIAAQTAEKLQFVKFGFQVAIMLYENKMKTLIGEEPCEGDVVIMFVT